MTVALFAVPVVATGAPPKRIRVIVSPVLLFLIALTALASPLANGYEYAAGDQYEQLPIVYRLLDSSALARDWYVNLTAGFNVRTVYAVFMAGLARFVGLDAAFALIYLAALLVIALSILLWAERMWRTGGVALPALLLVLYSGLGLLAGSFLIIPLLVPAFVALALALGGGALLLQGRLLAASLLIGLAGLVHAQIGPETGALLTFAAFMAASKVERKRILPWLPVLLTASALPALVAYLSTRPGAAFAESGEIIRILALMRGPHHYAPFTWGDTQWLNFAAYAALVVVARASVPSRAFLDWLGLGAFALCGLGIVAFAFAPLNELIKLDLFRATILLHLLGCLYLARYVWELFARRAAPGRIAGLVFLFCFLVAPRFAPDFTYILTAGIAGYEVIHRLVMRRSPRPPQFEWLTLVPVAAVLLSFGSQLTGAGWQAFEHNSVYLIVVTLSLALTAAGLWLMSGRAGLVATVGIIFAVALGLIYFSTWSVASLPAPLSRLAAAIQPHRFYNSAMGIENVERWAKENTQRDALFLIPPEVESFRTKAERAVVADWKAFPFGQSAILEWRDRMYELAGRSRQESASRIVARAEIVNGYRQLSEDALLGLADKYDVDYIVVQKPKRMSLELVYQSKKYRVYRVAP